MTKIALVQTTTTSDFEANLATALERVEQAAAAGVELVAFPEVFLFIGGRQGKLDNALEVEGEVVGRFREAAKRHGMAILLGSIHERIPGNPHKVHNTSIWIDAQGGIAGTYRKLKLFDVALPEVTIKESDTIEPGDALPPVLDTAIGKVGLTICFDLRYPDLYQHLRRQGAEIVFVPSSFTAPTGAAHWDTLLRARAVENQLFIAAPAQWGVHNPKFTSHGHTALVNPWGGTTALAANKPGIIIGEIDLEYLEKVRRELPMGVVEG
ncbi:MAG: carbon-nitrogen hydrolase family protein [SAR324 cluster bacterium]|nr:carbon-nitrogen hydrolase family protein [SAR324 cluster bacterium]